LTAQTPMLDTSHKQPFAPVLSEQDMRHRVGETLFVFLAILWLGLLLGVSLLATAVKFQAPSLDLPTALDVGRVTFAMFSRIEWALSTLVIASALLAGRWLAPRLGAGVALAVMLVVQAVWLLPVLDARVGRILAGETVAASSHHLLYIAAEGLKALLLLGLGAASAWSLTARWRPR
jgi:hypothetical protein